MKRHLTGRCYTVAVIPPGHWISHLDFALVGTPGAATVLGIGRRIFDVLVALDGKRSGTRGVNVAAVRFDDLGAAPTAPRMPAG